jgi:hypothetical protein
MESAMKSSHDDAKTIRRRMAQIRRKHHEDVREVLDGAEKVAGWGRHIWLYSWSALAAATVFWMVTSGRRMVQMNRASPESIPQDAADIKQLQVPDAERSTSRPSLLCEAASFLTTVAVRAAQNYAACCLEEWIAPRRVLGDSKSGPIPSSDEASTPDHRRGRTERATGVCDKLESVVLAGGSKDD